MFCLHSQAYKAVIKGKLLLFTVYFYKEVIRANLFECCVRHLFYIVLFHQCIDIDFGHRIDPVSDDRHHLYDAHVCAPRSKIFHDVKADSAAADDDYFLSGHVFRIVIVIDMLDHIKDAVYFAFLPAEILVESGDRREQRRGTGGVYDDIWL